MITVTRASEAWDLALQLTKWNIELNQEASERAGYSIHNDTNNPQNYICDLGTRLEINYADATKATNIWIEQKDEELLETVVFRLVFKNDSKMCTIIKELKVKKREFPHSIYQLALQASEAVKKDNPVLLKGFELFDYRYLGMVHGARILFEKSHTELNEYKMDLTRNDEYSRLDIMAIYRSDRPTSLNTFFRVDNLIELWKRAPEVEMTVAQIEEKLGYKIKIVSEE